MKITERSKGLWGSRYAFYLLAISSAFGLGNLWRFPYIVADNGGGAFVLLYIGLLFVVGLPLLISELFLGRTTRRSSVMALRQITLSESDLRKPVSFLGFGSLLLSVVVLSYFSVISGWVLHFLMKFIFALFSGEGLNPGDALNSLRANGWLQFLLSSVHLVLVAVIVGKDIEEGIEKWIGYIMPLFFILLLIMVVSSLSLESTPEALRFFFYPDFSKVTTFSFGNALGHVLFTLSLGLGSMVTFGSYMREETSIPAAGFRVVALDSFISLFAGVLIFPLVFAAGMGQTRGPELLFQTVPFLLSSINNGIYLGIGFFLCLYLAALGASIGILETMVANLREVRKTARPKASWSLGLICLALSVFPALSSTVFSNVNYQGKGLLEIIDLVIINWILPFVVLLMAVVTVRRLPEIKTKEQFTVDDPKQAEKLFRIWRFTLKWIVPLIVATILITNWLELAL